MQTVTNLIFLGSKITVDDDWSHQIKRLAECGRNPMDRSMPGFPVHHQLLELTQTHVHRVSDAIQPSHLLSFPCPLAFNLSSIRFFSNELVLHIRWPKYWSFSFNISPSVNIQDWFPLGLTGWISLLSKGLSSLLQHHSSKSSILQCSAFFIV